MRSYRKHQNELANAMREKGVEDFPFSVLAFVVPGGGKSWLPGIVAERFPVLKIGWFVPRLALRDQACRSMKKDFQIDLRESDNTPNPSRGLRGFVATHQALTADPKLYIQEFQRHPYLLVTDEIHHAKISPSGEHNELAGVLNNLAPLAKIDLRMTGTVESNGSDTIWGCHYESTPNGLLVVPERSANVFVRYERPTALNEGAIVPIEFYHHDGPAKYINKEGENEVILSMARNRKEDREALFTALRTDFADVLRNAGIDHWRERNSDGQVIVVCAYQDDAKRHYDILKKDVRSVGLAITDEGPEALQAIKDFKNGRIKVLVTVAMAYEGLRCSARQSHHLPDALQIDSLDRANARTRLAIPSG